MYVTSCVPEHKVSVVSNYKNLEFVCLFVLHYCSHTLMGMAWTGVVKNETNIRILGSELGGSCHLLVILGKVIILRIFLTIYVHVLLCVAQWMGMATLYVRVYTYSLFYTPM